MRRWGLFNLVEGIETAWDLGFLTLRGAARRRRLAARALRRVALRLEPAPDADRPSRRAEWLAVRVLRYSASELMPSELRLEPIASAPAEQLIPWIAPTLQRYLVGTL